MRTTAALFIVALVLGVCSDDDDAADSVAEVTTATTTTTATTSTTTPATTTTAWPTTTAGERTTTTDRDDATTDVPDTTDDDDGESTEITSIEDRLDTIEEALADGDFTLMLQALNLSGLADEIEDRQVTILAPTDDAFQDLGAVDLASLITDPGEIRDIINRHILDEVFTYDELSERDEVTTVSGETLQVTFEGGVLEVEGAVVTERDERLDGEQGKEFAVFAIDGVLLGEDS